MGYEEPDEEPQPAIEEHRSRSSGENDKERRLQGAATRRGGGDMERLQGAAVTLLLDAA